MRLAEMALRINRVFRQARPRFDTSPMSALLLLGHSKLESTVRYLGIEIDDALAMSEQIDV